MYAKEDMWLMEEIFQLSDRSLIWMINRLFHEKYQEDEELLKEWSGRNERGEICVQLMVSGFNRYVFCLGRREGYLQLLVRETGCLFDRPERFWDESIELHESPAACWGERSRTYQTVRSLPGQGKIQQETHEILLNKSSAEELFRSGLILFLPFLLYGFSGQKTLQTFLIHDIVGALKRGFQEAALSIFDVQRMKQLCRQLLWKLYASERWMQDMGFQELILKILDADMDGLERFFLEEK